MIKLLQYDINAPLPWILGCGSCKRVRNYSYMYQVVWQLQRGTCPFCETICNKKLVSQILALYALGGVISVIRFLND